MLNSHKNTVGVPLFGAPEISRSGTFSRRRELVAAGLLLLAGPLAASGPEVTWREILATAESFTDVVAERAVAIEGIRPFTEVLRAIYETFDDPPETHYFFCAVYYMPCEKGFTEARGFNTTSATLKGLGGRKYGADFLKATYVEGFSRLAEPVRGAAIPLLRREIPRPHPRQSQQHAARSGFHRGAPGESALRQNETNVDSRSGDGRPVRSDTVSGRRHGRRAFFAVSSISTGVRMFRSVRVRISGVRPRAMLR